MPGQQQKTARQVALDVLNGLNISRHDTRELLHVVHWQSNPVGSEYDPWHHRVQVANTRALDTLPREGC